MMWYTLAWKSATHRTSSVTSRTTPSGGTSDATDEEVVIIDGRAMTYRSYRGDDIRR